MKRLTLLSIILLFLIPTGGYGQAITDNGTNVGIGNASPLHRLDVNGNLNLSTGNALLIGGKQVVSTGGARNMFLGDGTGTNITTGGDNAIIGFKAAENLSTGRFNTVIGFKAGQTMSEALSNTIIGREAGKFNSGNQNVLIGRESGKINEGGENTFIGDRVGLGNSTGSTNTLIGSNSNVSSGELTNATAIGAGAIVGSSNSLVLGNNAKVGIGTTTPGYDLDVVGDINFTGDLYQNGVLYTGGIGATGPTGANGNDGLVGATGPTGPAGADGANGSVGATGPTGPSIAGPQGPAGVTGPIGPTGIQGSAGNDGVMGPTGPQGPTGVLLPGTTNQTLRHNGSSWEATTAFVNNGTDVSTTGKMQVGPAGEGVIEGATNLFIEATLGHLRLQTNGYNKNVSIHNEPGTVAYATFHGTNENLLIGTTGNYGNTKLRVVADGLFAGYFSADSADIGTRVIKAEFTGSGNQHVTGVYALADAADGYGYGVDAIGGHTGVKGYGDGGTSSNPAYGGNFTADGSGGNRIGVRGAATGTGTTNYGVFGHASGATNDWAGYFSGGNVYVHNFLGIGEPSPAYPISMTTTAARGFLIDHNGYAGQAHAINIDLDASNSNFQMGIQNTVTATGSNAIARPYNASAHADNGTATAYGGRFFAGGTSSGSKYGIYALTGGSGTQYAGYFDGDTYSTGNYLGSDRKLKRNIEPIEKAGEIVDALQAHTYLFRTDEFKSMALQTGQRFGFVSDELKKVLPQFVKTTTQPAEEVIDEDGNIKLIGEAIEFEAVNYVELIPILTAALQETRAELQAKDNRVDQLESQMKNVLHRLSEFDTDLQQCCFNFEDGTGSNRVALSEIEESDVPSLEQNQPNPFRENSVIKYYLPQISKSAQLVITDLNGVEMKVFNLQGKGFGQVLISGGSFKQGTYLYSLIVNGERIDSKRMMLF